MNFRKNYSLLAAAIAVIVSSLPLQAAESDEQIEASVKNTYVFKSYLGEDVHVAYDEGVVTLSGVVSEEAYITLAEDTIRDLPGVSSVDNQLTLKPDVPEKNSDAWLVAKVKTTLLFHRNVSAMTKVDAKDGIITLSGDADSEAEKELTSEYAMDVEGVSSVINSMNVVAMPREPAPTIGEMIDDASITAQVKMVLMAHRSTSALHTSVETTDGVVTLSGEARNDAEVSLASKISEDIRGVTRVNNIMTVEK